MKLLFKRRGDSIRWYLLGALVAMELLMSFSFLGYVHVEPISITTAYIPVLLAGAMLGPLDATAVGAVFGLASMWKASASYIMDFDQMFSPIMSGRPLESILLSVGSRALFGLIVGLLYLAAKRSRYSGLWVGVVSYFGRTVHSTLVYTTLWLCFPETGYTPLDAIRNLATVNGTAANLLSTGIVLVVWHFIHSRAWKQFVERLELVKTVQVMEHYHLLSMIGIIVLSLLSSVAVALYFVQRIAEVLSQKGIYLANEGYSDLVHLQIQFLFGILAMMALVIIFLAFNRRYTTYVSREAKLDPLTGTMSRKAFFQACQKILSRSTSEESAASYFIMVDIDCFKEINDLFGHPEGDRALKKAALTMKEIFGERALIGRVGGDEFAMLLHRPLTRQKLEAQLQRLMEQIQMIRIEDRMMSCSIGVQPVEAYHSAESLYQKADALLYAAKKNGKGRFVIGPSEHVTAADVPEE